MLVVSELADLNLPLPEDLLGTYVRTYVFMCGRVKDVLSSLHVHKFDHTIEYNFCTIVITLAMTYLWRHHTLRHYTILHLACKHLTPPSHHIFPLSQSSRIKTVYWYSFGRPPLYVQRIQSPWRYVRSSCAFSLSTCPVLSHCHAHLMSYIMVSWWTMNSNKREGEDAILLSQQSTPR